VASDLKFVRLSSGALFYSFLTSKLTYLQKILGPLSIFRLSIGKVYPKFLIGYVSHSAPTKNQSDPGLFDGTPYSLCI